MVQWLSINLQPFLYYSLTLISVLLPVKLIILLLTAQNHHNLSIYDTICHAHCQIAEIEDTVLLPIRQLIKHNGTAIRNISHYR